MNARLSKFAFLLLPVLAGGCFTLETASLRAPAARGTSARAPIAHTVVANNGWYLFNAWPLACGDAQSDDSSWVLFRNDVNLDLLHGRLMRHAAARGCDVEELNVFNDEQVLLSIPGMSIPLPIPYVITYREMQLSGILVRHTAPVAGGVR